MKRLLLIFLLPPILFMLGLGILFLTSGGYRDDAFDENTAGIVDVILRDKEDGSLSFRAIGSGQRPRKIDPFPSKPLRVYRKTSPHASSVKDGEIVNRLTDTHMTDESGNTVRITPGLQRIMELAAGIDHNVMELYVLHQQGHLFAVAELNVNLWWPCVLYYYDAENDALVELYTADAQDYIGLRIRNPENIHADA